jgi:hypothetical protein
MGRSSKRRRLESNSSCYYDSNMTVVITDDWSNEEYVLSLTQMDIGNNVYENVIHYSKDDGIYYRDDGYEIDSLEDENITSESELYENYTQY